MTDWPIYARSFFKWGRQHVCQEGASSAARPKVVEAGSATGSMLLSGVVEHVFLPRALQALQIARRW
jgi:hypothetical protein